MPASIPALLCAAVLIAPRLAFGAQSVDDGTVSLRLTLEGADQIAGTLPHAYRLYVTPDSIRISLSLGNQSNEAIVVDQRRVQDLLRLQLAMNGPSTKAVAIAARWLPDIRMPGRWATFTNSWAALTIEPSKAISWIISLQRIDGSAFDSGAYALTYEVPDLQSAISKTDGRLWVGRYPSRSATVQLVISPPRTPREISAAHQTEARDASLKNDHATAAAAYSRALAADPSDTNALSGLANSLLALKRYKEASPLYQRLLQSASGRLTYELAALAYLGADDERNARRMLQAAGLSDEDVRGTVARLRARILRQ